MRPEQLRAAIAGLLLALAAATAHAEPYLAVRSGAKCSDCHTNLDGGGKRTAFAHIHSHDILHDLRILPLPAGVESFNGEISPYVSIGSDLRVRSTTTWNGPFTSSGRVEENRAFRPHFQSEDIAVQEALGYIETTLWPDVLSLYGDFNAAGGGVTARETFALLKLPFYDFFMKAGRYFPPFGLRVYEDEHYIRTNTGFTFQNPFEGVEFGIIPGPFYLATSVTNGSGNRNVIYTVNGYGMFEDLPVVRNVLAGASFANQSNKRNATAIYAGSNIWKFTYLGEFDIIDDRTAAAAPTGRDKFASYAEVDLLLFDWFNIRGTFDFLKVSGNRDQVRYQIGAEPFIDRFIQPRLYYVIQNAPGNMPQLNVTQLVFELHFFF